MPLSTIRDVWRTWTTLGKLCFFFHSLRLTNVARRCGWCRLSFQRNERQRRFHSLWFLQAPCGLFTWTHRGLLESPLSPHAGRWSAGHIDKSVAHGKCTHLSHNGANTVAVSQFRLCTTGVCIWRPGTISPDAASKCVLHSLFLFFILSQHMYPSQPGLCKILNRIENASQFSSVSWIWIELEIWVWTGSRIAIPI